ncbi:hypothetical protein LG329_03970 [Virgibacillus necropolis]|uniref:hypothetical protein n=1 Tax=Virgibacillus necropolis TaxID=163877 RepID=UPI00384A5458
MGFVVFILIIVMAALVDLFWLDTNRKRWGWMENWSKLQKTLFFSVFILASGLIYIGLGSELL